MREGARQGRTRRGTATAAGTYWRRVRPDLRTALLSDPDLVLPTIMLIDVWQWTPIALLTAASAEPTLGAATRSAGSVLAPPYQCFVEFTTV